LANQVTAPPDIRVQRLPEYKPLGNLIKGALRLIIRVLSTQRHKTFCCDLTRNEKTYHKKLSYKVRVP